MPFKDDFKQLFTFTHLSINLSIYNVSCMFVFCPVGLRELNEKLGGGLQCHVPSSRLC